MDSSRTELGRSDKWGLYYGYWDDWIASSKLGGTLGKSWNDLGNTTNFWGFSFPHTKQ